MIAIAAGIPASSRIRGQGNHAANRSGIPLSQQSTPLVSEVSADHNPESIDTHPNTVEYGSQEVGSSIPKNARSTTLQSTFDRDDRMFMAFRQ
jgi:hypothetical protein